MSLFAWILLAYLGCVSFVIWFLSVRHSLRRAAAHAPLRQDRLYQCARCAKLYSARPVRRRDPQPCPSCDFLNDTLSI